MSKALLSHKQIDSIKNSDARLNFWVGPVRSGKSYSCFWRFLDFLLDGPSGPVLITGRTEPTIKRNIIRPLYDLVGDDMQYKSGSGELVLWGRTIDVVGANDERAEAKIRGSEFVCALMDEVTIIPENFVKMLFSRLSLDGAKFFGTTNPDSPFHWLKEQYLDKDEVNKKIFSFSMEDNPSLSEEYKADLRKEYAGLWYQRYILGEWALAEGTIYDFFDPQIHTIPHPPGPATTYIVGIDYGTNNPCVFTLIGHNASHYPNIWLEKEYYYDSKATLRQKSDSEYVKELKKFIAGYPVSAIYVDPSALSFKVEMRREGINDVYDAKNDVIPGIRFQGQLLSNGTYKICTQCVHSIKEYSTYLWDERATKRGIDAPLKQNDHCFVAGTKVMTDKGEVAIERLKAGDRVFTRNGFRKIYGTWESENEVDIVSLTINDITINCTKNHKFIVNNNERKEAYRLTHKDTFYILTPQNEGEQWKENQLFGTKKHIHDGKILPIYQTQTILEEEEEKDIYIEINGNTIMERSRRDMKSTTSMEIQPTTKLIIWNAYHENSIENGMEKISLSKNEKSLNECVQVSALLQKNGINQTKEESGIELMQKDAPKREKLKNMNVKCAKRNLCQKEIEPSSAQITVNHNGGEQAEKTITSEYVFDVEQIFKQTNIQELNIVRANAQHLAVGKIERKEKVFNLTVEEDNEYFVEGILVANCSDAQRYALYTHFFDRLGDGMDEEEAYKMEAMYGRTPFTTYQ